MREWLGHIGALAVTTVWGTTFVSSKVLLNSGMSPAEIFLLRFIMAYVCLCIVCHGKWKSDSWRDELIFVGLGITGGSLYFLIENMALLYTATSNVSILVSSCPLLTALVIGLFYPAERLCKRQLLCSIVAFIGMALIVLNGHFLLHISPLGDMLALCAAMLWAFYSLFMHKSIGHYSTDFITRKVFFYGLLTILPYFLFRPWHTSLASLMQPKVVGNLLFLGLVASTGGYLLWNWVLKKVGTVKATNYIYLQPMITMLLAAVVLGERVTWMAVLGTVILIAGMIGVERNRR